MHLEALKVHYGPAATASLTTAIQQLESRGGASPRLTHGHLNRLGKAQKALDQARKNLGEVDSKWQSFVAKTRDSLQTRFQSYQEDRKKAVLEVNQASANVAAMKEEVKLTVASMNTAAVELDGEAVPSLEEM